MEESLKEVNRHRIRKTQRQPHPSSLCLPPSVSSPLQLLSPPHILQLLYPLLPLNILPFCPPRLPTPATFTLRFCPHILRTIRVSSLLCDHKTISCPL